MKKFKVEHEGKEVELMVVRPDFKAEQAGRLAYARQLKEAADAGAFLARELNEHLRRVGAWDDDRAAQYEELVRRLRQGAKLLAVKRKDGRRMKMTELREVALQMRSDRAELLELTRERESYDLATADSLAEDEKFATLVAACTLVAETGKPFFKSREDYHARRDEPATLRAASEFGKLHYRLDDDWQKKLEENEFLLKHKMADDKLRLVSPDGRLVDSKGREVDSDGYLVQAGCRVDEDGTPLDDRGRYVESDDYEDDWGA